MIDIKTILFPTDFSQSSDHALKYALSLARKYGARIHILHVIEDLSYAIHPDMLDTSPLTDLVSEHEERSEEALQEVVPEELREEIDWVSLVGRGVPYYEIVNAAQELDVDIIVCGTHGPTGLKHVFFGSVAERIVRRAPCPVLTVCHPNRVPARASGPA